MQHEHTCTYRYPLQILWQFCKLVKIYRIAMVIHQQQGCLEEVIHIPSQGLYDKSNSKFCSNLILKVQFPFNSLLPHFSSVMPDQPNWTYLLGPWPTLHTYMYVVYIIKKRKITYIYIQKIKPNVTYKWFRILRKVVCCYRWYVGWFWISIIRLLVVHIAKVDTSSWTTW